MRKTMIAFFSAALLLGTLTFMSCSKETPKELPVPVDPGKPVEPGKPTPNPDDVFPAHTVGITNKKMDNQQGNITDYVLYIPDGYNEKKNYRWPVVISLHGVGEIGNDVNVVKRVGLPRVVAGKEFVMVAPQCLRNWWNIATLQILYKEILAKYHVDSSRVYLTGLSMGGMTTCDWSVAYPDQFAAIVPISGMGDVNKACNLKAVPVWAFHNADDPTVDVKGSRNMVAALKACGGNVQYTENATGGHNAWDKAYANPALYTWMLQQHK